MTAWFTYLATRVSAMAGSPWAFLAALAFVLGWFVAGLFVGFTDSHQIRVNTPTTILTFLLVFLLQNTTNRQVEHDQKRDEAMHLKLDEIVRATDKADDTLVGIEKEMEED